MYLQGKTRRDRNPDPLLSLSVTLSVPVSLSRGTGGPWGPWTIEGTVFLRLVPRLWFHSTGSLSDDSGGLDLFPCLETLPGSRKLSGEG